MIKQDPKNQIPPITYPSQEKDPSGKQAGDLGTKLDLGKQPVFQGLINYFPNACMAVAEVSDFGSRKYVWGGWKTVPNGINRYKDAMLRHICKQSIEGDIDPDSGLLHAAHIAWGSLATLELILLEKKNEQALPSTV